MERIPNIRHLAAVAATVKHGSVTRAAEAINLTQPALTQAIGRLERELDCQLFQREPAGMRPTEPARLLAIRVEKAIDLIGSPRVTSTQMHAFLSLARAGSYSGAADRTGVSAASLHRAVNDLSVALGEKLVDRRGRHLVLTRRGEAIVRRMGIARSELRSGLAEVNGWLGRHGGRIVIGAMPLSRAQWLPAALLDFLKPDPQVDVAIVEGSYSELVGPLREGEVDFLLGALRGGGLASDLSEKAAFVDRPKIIGRSDHPALRKGASLDRFSWILPSRATPLRGYWEQMMHEAGLEAPHIGIECGSVLTIRELLLETDALTLLSPAQLRVEIDAGLLVASDPPVPIERTIGITTRRDWRATPVQGALLETLRVQAVNLS